MCRHTSPNSLPPFECDVIYGRPRRSIPRTIHVDDVILSISFCIYSEMGGMRRSGCGIGLQTSVSVTDVRVIALTRSVCNLYVSVSRKHSGGKCRRVWLYSVYRPSNMSILIYRHTGHEHASTTARRRRRSHFANRTYIIHIAQARESLLGRGNNTWTNLDLTKRLNTYPVPRPLSRYKKIKMSPASIVLILH